MPSRKITDLDQISAVSDEDLMLIREVSAVYDRKMPISQLAEKLTGGCVCDTGPTLPTSPVIGQWFLHTPTGRKILYCYNGSNWHSSVIRSFGSMTVHVNATDGTDDMNHGTAVDSDAFATIQYAIDSIPGLFGGHVIININAETYDESIVITGKLPIGEYTITLQGTLVEEASNTQTNSGKGAGATQGSIQDTGDVPATDWDNLLLYSSNNDEYKLIDDTPDVDTMIIVGTWSATPSGTYKVYSWGTVLNGSIAQNNFIKSNQKAIILNNLSLTSASTAGLRIDNYSEIAMTNCKIKPDSGKIGILLNNHSSVSVRNSFIDASGAFPGYGIKSMFSLISLYSVKILSNNSGTGVAVWNLSALIISEGSIIEEGTYGLSVKRNSFVSYSSVEATGYNRIRDCGSGIRVLDGGIVIGTVNNQYSGNTTDENATAASFGFID